MDDLTKLWERWSEGVVPPEAMLWGMELYWWNRLAIALQALALVIVFFELIGTDRRRKIVAFFDAEVYYTMTAKICSEIKNLATLIDVALRASLLSIVYLFLYSARASLKRLEALLPAFTRLPVSRLRRPLARTMLKMQKIDKQLKKKHENIIRFWISYVSFVDDNTAKDFRMRLILVIFLIFSMYANNDPVLSDMDLYVAEPWFQIILFMLIFCIQTLAIPLFIISSTVRIVFYLFSPLFKRFFHEHYEHHWMAAILLTGLFGLHFAILIG